MLTHRTTTILGNIPEDWDKALLKSLLSEQQGGAWGDDEGELAIRVLRSTNFTSRGTLDLEGSAIRYFPQVKAKTFILTRNDILLERSGGGPAQPVGRVGFLLEDLQGYWFSNFVQLLRPNRLKINPEFLGWLLLRLNQSGIVERLQHQTTQMRNLDFRDYLRVYLPVPKSAEQETVAKLLQLATGALECLDHKVIAARRLKTALLHQLFTTGIPGWHATFQKAKVFRHEFEVPSDWNVEPLRLSVNSVEYGTNEPSNDAEHGLPVVAIPQVVASRFRLGDCSYVELPEAEAAALRLANEDVLLIRTNGNAEYIGKSTVVGEEADSQHIVFASYLIRVRTDKTKLRGRYLN
jgi:type I restriction enzyme, S subunit